MFLSLSKFFYVLFLFYLGWFQQAFFQIPRMPLVLGLGMLGFLVLYKLGNGTKVSFVVTKPLLIWICFCIYILFSGFFIAYDFGYLASSWFTYLQILAMIFFIINISEIDGDIDFFIKIYILFSIVYMFSMLFWGFHIGGRVFLSENSNPNTDGQVLLFGVFCVLFLTDSKRFSRLIVPFALVMLFMYTIILAASRASFLTAVLLVLFWLLFSFPRVWKKYSIVNKVLSISIISIVFVALFYRFVPLFMESILFQRLSKGVLISSDVTRSGMYREAFQFFLDNPLVGIGFNQYRLLSIYTTYSHSTYAEILSTTGLVGTVIYFSAYLVIFYDLFRLFTKSRGTKAGLKSLNFLLLIFVILVLGTGVIHFYQIINNIMFALMISFVYLEKRKNKDNILASYR